MADSLLHKKALGCMLGGTIGDALGTPSEGKEYTDIEDKFGWIGDFEGTGTDDTIMKHLLSRALIRTRGCAGRDDWAAEWLSRWNDIFGVKVGKFFMSVLHTAHKMRRHSTPRMAALGNMPSSSSAMAISPVGIVNACRPRSAAEQAYNLASLIHTYDVSFCQDGSAALAAAGAEAFKADADVEGILSAATLYLEPTSGREMLDCIDRTLALAREKSEFKAFRQAVYERRDIFFRPIACDSRETVPLALALFLLADGDFEKSVSFGANFGRDADTIATMVGALTGALTGVDGIKADWVTKIDQADPTERELAQKLAQTAIEKNAGIAKEQALFDKIAG